VLEFLSQAVHLLHSYEGTKCSYALNLVSAHYS
jgi:hypothetical protein